MGLSCDVIVVGAGAAGCAAAARLAAEPGLRVLLVEAGGHAWRPSQQVPKGFLWAMQDPRLAYHYPTEPVDGRAETWLRGRALGGSTAINGMMFLHGDPSEWDALENAGNPGWGWTETGRVLRELAGSARRGWVSTRPDPGTVGDPVIEAVLAGAERLGVPWTPDANAASGPRIGYTPSMIRNGRRVSAATLLHGAARRRVRTLTGTRAATLLLQPGPGRPVVSGVRLRGRGGAIVDVRARREVLVCAGAVETVLLLERSGIGDPETLTRIGVPVRVEAPRLGSHVTEQRSVTLKVRLRTDVGLGPLLGTRRGRARTVARYVRTRTGALATGPYELTGMLALGGGTIDTQLLCTALATDDTGLQVAGYPGLMLQAYRIRPTSESSVHAGGPDPDTPPVIVAHHLATADDRAAAARILSWQRDLLACPPLSDLVAEEVHPGPEVADAGSAARYALASGAGIFHAVGSAAMGPADTDVVDPRLRVRGVQGLRVADAGVLPFHVAGGTAAPAMIVGHRAAEFVLGE